MRFITLFFVLNIFLCNTSISSTLNNFVAEEKSEVPSCHIVAGNNSSGANTEKADEVNFSFPQDEISSSCCLLSLINSKDLDNNFQYTLTLIDNSNFFEKITLPKIKANITFFEMGHGPPDLVIQKSSFLI